MTKTAVTTQWFFYGGICPGVAPPLREVHQTPPYRDFHELQYPTFGSGGDIYPLLIWERCPCFQVNQAKICFAWGAQGMANRPLTIATASLASTRIRDWMESLATNRSSTVTVIFCHDSYVAWSNNSVSSEPIRWSRPRDSGPQLLHIFLLLHQRSSTSTTQTQRKRLYFIIFVAH